MAADERPPEGGEQKPARSPEAAADDAELKGHLAFEGDREAMGVVDELTRQQGAGPNLDPEFRQKLRDRLVAQAEQDGDARKEG